MKDKYYYPLSKSANRQDAKTPRRQFLKIITAFFSLLLMPLFGLAADNIPAQGPNLNLLTPDAIRNGTDLSIGYLQNIFGVVDGVLHGSGSQIMGQMFMVFNAGALFLGAVIIIYTMLVSTLNTAHEGEMLGRKWKSIWIPIRSALGIALLLPKATGYCTIQIFMMWVIVQGVGLADSVWNQATNYLARGGVIVQQSLAPDPTIAKNTKNIFRSMACVYGLQDAMQAARKDYIQKNPNANPPLVPDLGSTVNPMKATYDSNGTATVSFPGKISPNAGGMTFDYLTGACGTVSWAAFDPNTVKQAGFDPSTLATTLNQYLGQQPPQGGNQPSPPNLDQAQQIYFQYIWAKQVGVQQIILDSIGPARQYINNQFQFNLTGTKPTIPDPSTYLSSRMFLDTAEDYQGITYPSVRSLVANLSNQGMTLWISGAQSQGWIMAGRYYADLAGMSSNANVFNSSSFASPTANGEAAFLSGSLKDIPTKLPSALNGQISGVIDQLTSTSGTLNTFITNAQSEDMNYGGRTNITAPSASGTVQGVGDTIAAILYPIIGPIIAILGEFSQLANAQGTNSNPVVILSLMGANMMTLVAQVWVIGAISMGAATGALGAAFGFTFSNAILAILNWTVPFLWVILGALFVNGAVLVYYIPMIPFILFLFGAIGWLILTIEAMVAAPIVALGITHPEGNEVLGKADPAVLILVNVFLRPSMMVIGLIAGIIMSYVGIWVLNAGFFGAFWGQMFGTLSGVAWLFGLPAMFIVYTTLVIIIMNQAFQLINVIPDRILRWLGQAGESISGEATRMMGEVQSGFKGGMQETGSGMGQTIKAAGERSDKRQTQGTAAGTSGAGGGGGGVQLGPSNTGGPPTP